MVNQVTTQLRPNVLKIVQASVSSAGIDTDTTQLLEVIMVQLRPVVLSEVRRALATSPFPLDANSLTDRIVLKLRPFVAEALERELAQVKEKAQTQVVDDVKAEIQSEVKNVIQATVTATGANLDDPRGLVEIIINQLRPTIFQAVQIALQAVPHQFSADDITIRIIIEITPSIEIGVDEQVEVVKEQQNDSFLIDLINRLKPAIVNTVGNLGAISDDLLDEIVRVIPGRVSPVVTQKVANLMRQPGSDSLSDSVLAQRVVDDMNGDIIQAIRDDDTYKVIIGTDDLEGVLRRIKDALRPIILRQIAAYRLANPVVVPKPVPPPAPVATNTGGLTSIFGISGQNKVRVNSPNANYGYEFDS